MADEAARTFFSKKKLKIDVCENVVERLKKLNVLESRSPNFHEKLCFHFDRMPARYAMLVNSDANLDVLRHNNLLDIARNPAKRPAVHVREFKVHPGDELTRQSLHEITCATTDGPEPFQFATALHSMGLTIKEASMLSTTDGYCLLVFVVRSNTVQTVVQLSNALQKELLKANQRRAGPVQVSHDPENAQPSNQSERSRWLMAAKIIYYGAGILLAFYFGIVGAFLVKKGQQPENIFADPAVKIGSRLLGHESTETKDVGIALAFIAIPLVGVASILALFAVAIYTSLKADEKFLILFWLCVDIVLGIWYPFIRTKTSTLMSKVAGMITMLSTILAAVTGFYRKLGR